MKSSPYMDADRKRAIRRTTLWLVLLALAFYVGFIVLTISRAN
jgi:hypothetical protein